MIYKFENIKYNTSLEVEKFEDDLQSQRNEVVSFSCTDASGDCISVELDKKEVYYLIGALHLLHKEMK